MRFATRSLLGSAGVFALAVSAFAQVGRLAGSVTDEEAQPLKGVDVTLTNPETGQHKTANTDARGRWAALGLDSGTWEVDFELEGYVARMVRVRVAAAPLRPLEIRLERAGPPREVVEAAEKGDVAYKAGRFAEARGHYETLLAARPDLAAMLHLQIARCYKEESNRAKELEHLEGALAADPGNKEVQTLLALETLEAGNTERALELLDESVIRNPDVFYNIGVVLLNQDRRDDAVAYFTKAVGLDAAYVDGYFQRGLVQFGLDRLAQAKADFEKVIELAPPSSPQAETARKVLDSLADRK